MARLLRGEVRWADLGEARGREQKGQRPVLILSRDAFNQHSETVIAAVLTTKQPRVGFPLIVELSESSVRRKRWVKTGQVRTLSEERVHGLVGRATTEEIERVIKGLNQIIGWGSGSV